MNQYVPYIFAFIVILLLIKFIMQLSTRHSTSWQKCAQKYRFSFKEGSEEQNNRSVYVYRLRGYYRTCMVTIYSSPTNPAETSVMVNYPKGLLDSLRHFPDGTLSRAGRLLIRQTVQPGSENRGKRPFMVTVPATKGMTGALEVQRELNPNIREQLIQLSMVCAGRGRKLDITDAYVVAKQLGFTSNPEPLFGVVDEILYFINILEAHSSDLLIN